MKLSEARKAYVFTKKFKIIDGEQYITVREPNMDELKTIPLDSEDQEKTTDAFRALLPRCIVESSLEDEDGEPATGEQIVELLTQSTMTFAELMRDWIESCPFASRQENSKK